VLCHQLDHDGCPLAVGSDNLNRAAQVIRNANHLGARTFIHPADICSGNKKLNISFCAQIFNVNHGLKLTEERRKSVRDMAPLDFLDMDNEVSREEIVFRNWINSLNIENVYIQNDLFGALEDGVVLIKVIDTVEPGVVTWRK
jgi:plastin-1